MKEEYERFNLFQIVQHMAWLWSFLVLAATGLSFKFAHSEVAKFYVNAIGGYEVRALIHRTTAGFWISLAILHIFYYTLINRGTKKIIPVKKDWFDFIAHWRYLLHRSDEKPRFDRYTWYEKFEYWAGGAGFIVIASTGLLMWLKFDITLKYLPLSVINLARRVHGWEAVLAVLFLSVFHMYNAIWRPSIFPMAGQWVSGIVSRKVMLEDHPLELENIEKKK